ncbi:PHD-finger domain-containing protein [Phthorimaea operculella]|nr:PHD-finger domain-containing protein [Phthorimaea operculella]
MSDDGSEDSPPRPVRRKIKNVMIVSSASDSDSDESVLALATRRKRLRVLSDDGASSSSSSGSAVVARRKRALPALRDSDAESDSSGWATDHSAPGDASSAQPKKTSGFSSDSSEGNSDKCSICLLRFKDQEVGTPETCEHLFCLDCITEWSRNVNTCPVDRMTFNSIVVRACAGGRVLRTDPVKVVERRPSVEIMVVEDPTPCEICGSTDNEETMLLCDGCDLGFHMQCLTPPLTEVPPDQWLCPNCDDLLDVIHISELDDLFSGIADLDMPEGPRAVALRAPRNVRRSARTSASASLADQPSTSSGRRGSAGVEPAAPSTSRSTRTSRTSRATSSRATTRRRTTGTHRRKYKRRRTRTVIIEYEVQEGGKFPVTKTVKRRLKKKKSRKRPRTAARRSHVRASVRAKLADMRLDNREALSQTSNASTGVQALSVSRQRAGIPALSLFGNPHQLDFFEEEEVISEGASVAISAPTRPTSAIASAYRQARRKMAIPSPTHASAAPDILSSILESQTLLHSKRSIVSVTVDGQVDIKLHKKDSSRDITRRDKDGDKKDDRVDVSKSGAESSRKAPMYSGGGGRGWGGGYRGGRVPPAAPQDNHYQHHNQQEMSHGHQGSAGGHHNNQVNQSSSGRLETSCSNNHYQHHNQQEMSHGHQGARGTSQ